MVAPQINKYYFMDLAPRRSFVENAVGHGIPFFTVSWRNPGVEQRDWDMDTHAAAVLRAIDVTCDVGRSDELNLLSLCAAAAIAAGDPELGERLGRLALEARAGAPAALVVARACAVRQRYADAEELLGPLEGVFGTQETAIAYLQQRAIGLMWGLNRAEEAMALVNRAMEWWAEPTWRRKLTPIRLRAVAMTTDFRAAGELCARALADEELGPEERRQVEVIHSVQLLHGGRVRQACELIVRLRPPIPLRDEADELAMATASIAGMESGWEIDDVERWMSRAFAEAIRTYDGAAAGLSAGTLGGLCMLRGRYLDAARWLREAVVHLEYHDPFRTLKAAHAMLAGVAYYRGDTAGVATAMERSRAAATGKLATIERAYMVRGEAWLALSQGDPAYARRLLLDSAESFREPIHAMGLYHEAMRAGAPASQVCAPLTALRQECDGRLSLVYADDALARTARDGAAVLACADEFEAIGALRHASECAAAAAGIFAQDGRADSARRAAVRSRELNARCQGGLPPEVHGLEPDAFSLTERERQFAELAAQGLSNAEIADRFVLSVRTVESHLYRAMQKLGVKDRRELKARSRPHL